MLPLLESSLKVAAILALALASLPLLRRRPAALRHLVLAAAVLAAVAAPVVQMVAPGWQVPLDPIVALPAVPGGGDPLKPGSTDPASGEISIRPIVQAGSAVLTTVWAVGAALMLAVLITGVIRLAVLASRARTITSGRWAACADEIRRELRLGPVTVLQSHHPSLLITWGIRSPKVLVPERAMHWPEDRVRLVIAHELAHIRRGDWPVQLAAELLRAVHWFNPIVWLACRRLRHESEQACDDSVINGGVEGPEYATHLVNIARELQVRPTWVPAPSIARTSNLERRIRTMLDTRIDRRPPSRASGLFAVLALLAIVIPISGAAVAQVFGSLSGSIVDPTNGAVPGVTLVMTNTETQAKYEVRSDRSGRYEFVGLAPGSYVLEAKMPGFARFQGRLAISGQTVQRDLKLGVGELQETITVRASRSEPAGSPAAQRTSGTPLRRREPPTCDGTATGGNIRPPVKLFDVRPYYPPSAVQAGAAGTARLRSTIGPDGSVEDVQVVSSPNAELSSAATDAVRQWLYDPTYLNCVAIPVTMNVTVNFEIQP